MYHILRRGYSAYSSLSTQKLASLTTSELAALWSESRIFCLKLLVHNVCTLFRDIRDIEMSVSLIALNPLPNALCMVLQVFNSGSETPKFDILRNREVCSTVTPYWQCKIARRDSWVILVWCSFCNFLGFPHRHLAWSLGILGIVQIVNSPSLTWIFGYSLTNIMAILSWKSICKFHDVRRQDISKFRPSQIVEFCSMLEPKMKALLRFLSTSTRLNKY